MLVNLKAEMVRSNITSMDIASVLGKSIRAVNSRLNGGVEIKAEELKQIRDRFFPGCDLDYLLCENPRPPVQRAKS